MFKRTVKNHLESLFNKGKVIILYGARQVGKTTLVKEIIAEKNLKVKYIDCDIYSNRLNLSTEDEKLLKDFVGENELVVIDEAQRVPNIGLNLKILHNYCPNTQFIATGSSSFDLANKINEPLTGRSREISLYPLSLVEINQEYDKIKIGLLFDSILRFGTYPGVFNLSQNDAREELDNLSNNYLYKDLLEFEEIRKSGVLLKLLQLLAITIGSEVNYQLIGEKIGLNRLTAQKYIDLLEKSFIIKVLRPLNRNPILREISKPFKIYFWDLGIRNSIIEDFRELALRDDVGKLWENFCIIERIKLNKNSREIKNYYFWRTQDQKEYDLIEEKDGVFEVFEIKWNQKKKLNVYTKFIEAYPNSKIEVINRENYWKFLI